MSEDDVTRASELLEALLETPELLAELAEPQRRRLLEAAGRLTHPHKGELRQRAKAFRRRDRKQDKELDLQALESASLRKQKLLSAFLPQAIHAQLGIGIAARALPSAGAASGHDRAERGDAEPTASEPTLKQPRACYVCKQLYHQVHHFYHAMCPRCAEFNLGKREQSAPLEGRVALVTGARIKIGYHITLKLLRAGARVLCTTRFPVNAAQRFAQEADYESFADRLEVHGLDLRHTPSVERFANHLAGELSRLDILINNAAQTVRRPPAFYQHLLEHENVSPDLLPARTVRLLASSRRSSSLAAAEGRATSYEAASLGWAMEPAESADLFPENLFDGDDQQIDLREDNSWRMELSDVPTPELLEVHLVNAIAPFVLTSKLKPLMMQDRSDEKHVIHVSAMEASFSRKKKTVRHPHTNMAKAALNMMTRTSASEYASDGIFMNSVDTGWITDEDPLHHAVRKERDYDFSPPLDAIDGAARVLDPLFFGLLQGEHPWGLFFKDYLPIDW